MITLGKECSDYSIPVSALKKVDLVTLPRPYPTFLSYYFKGGDGGGGGFDLADVESLQVSIGPGISSDNLEDSIEIGIESIRLE
jgi:hypothetical protein